MDTEKRDIGNGSEGEGKRFVGDVGKPLATASEKASASFGMILFAVAAGFVIGLAVWAVFCLSSALCSLLWVDARAACVSILDGLGLPSWWLPMAFCSAGGLIIGVWTARFGGAPESLDKVMATVRQTGGYKLERPLASVVGFLLPLVFGGSIGPEAGLTGIIAAACTRIGNALKSAGLRVKGVADVTVSAAVSAVFGTPLAGIVATVEEGMPRSASEDAESAACAPDPDAYEFRRGGKLVLYTASAMGAVLGIMAVSAVFGGEGGIPRFEGAELELSELWWALPCLLVGYIGAVLYHLSTTLFTRINEWVGHHPIAKPLFAGHVMGVLSIPLPYVLFSGEAQSFELMTGWQGMTALVLIGTGLAKCVATPLCLHFGWQGGHFFPCIFAGIAVGYGVASIGSADPMLCVSVATASLVAGVQRRPLVALALLLLCFPVKSVPLLGLACLLGAFIPMPRAIVK